MNFCEQYEICFGELKGKDSSNLKSPMGIGIEFYEWLILVTDNNIYGSNKIVMEINCSDGDYIIYKDLHIKIQVINHALYYSIWYEKNKEPAGAVGILKYDCYGSIGGNDIGLLKDTFNWPSEIYKYPSNEFAF